jgi:hypothetical protein
MKKQKPVFLLSKDGFVQKHKSKGHILVIQTHESTNIPIETQLEDKGTAQLHSRTKDPLGTKCLR